MNGPEDRLIETIGRHWSIGAVVALRRIDRGLVNRSIRVETLDGAAYILRLYHPAISSERIGREHDLLNRLAEVDFPLSPRLIPPAEPPTWRTLVPPFRHHRYLALLTLLPGEDRYTWDRPPGTPHTATVLGRALALYHLAVWGWKPARRNVAADEAQRLAGLRVRLKDEPLAAATLDQLTTSLAGHDRSAWPDLMVHGDFHAANVRWTDPDDDPIRETICGIFDFEYADHNWRLYDVGLAAACLATRWQGDACGGTAKGGVDPQLLAAFLAGYDSTVAAKMGPRGALPPLQQTERAALFDYLALAHLLTLDWVQAPTTGHRLDPADAVRYANHARNALTCLLDRPAAAAPDNHI